MTGGVMRPDRYFLATSFILFAQVVFGQGNTSNLSPFPQQPIPQPIPPCEIKSSCEAATPPAKLITIKPEWGPSPGPIVCRYLQDKSSLVTLTFDQEGKYIFCHSNEGDGGYLGCGVAVAQSALHYFGIEMTRNDVAKSIPSHSVPGSGIFTYPSSLAKGIQTLLELDGMNELQLVVQLDSGKKNEDIVAHPRDGFPVIALVDSGAHYVLVVAYSADSNQFMVIDSEDGGPNLAYWRTIDLNFNTINSIGSVISSPLTGSDDSWVPGTIISFVPQAPIGPSCKLPTKACGSNCCAGTCCGTSCCAKGERCCAQHCC
jgi:hypothetical protein